MLFTRSFFQKSKLSKNMISKPTKNFRRQSIKKNVHNNHKSEKSNNIKSKNNLSDEIIDMETTYSHELALKT